MSCAAGPTAGSPAAPRNLSPDWYNAANAPHGTCLSQVNE
ncbi:hypothetical protein RR42_m1321 [Cupriavidus basilensis]|uniref:Uncharacterized protein n=1 Tax=Cupriavidus basilensis TaxID=68895 RepID=A0A0C4YDD2_9BURK|nr:hypothetical protein RR42_m1321 [Cupriavidus basilensis]